MPSSQDKTRQFTGARNQLRAALIRRAFRDACQALEEKGYRSIDQIVGYLMSGDPAYITSHRNARRTMQDIPRDELIEELVRFYLSKH